MRIQARKIKRGEPIIAADGCIGVALQPKGRLSGVTTDEKWVRVGKGWGGLGWGRVGKGKVGWGGEGVGWGGGGEGEGEVPCSVVKRRAVPQCRSAAMPTCSSTRITSTLAAFACTDSRIAFGAN